MSLLENLAGQLLGGGGAQSGGGGLAGMALQMLMGQMGGGGGTQTSGLAGGLGSLLQLMQSKGMGDVASSWVGTGQNMPISADQLSSLLGGGQISQLAQQAGLSEQDAASQLAGILPGLVDKLTPAGQVPEQSDLMSTGMGLLNSLLGGR